MILAVFKPKGPSSNQLLTQIKKLTRIKKIGHAGTLDPLASGVLVVAIGRDSTKKISEEVKKEKEYIADVKLGQNSTTDDEEGEKTKWEVEKVPKVSEVSKVLEGFIGKVKQTPPVYSAVKVSGQESYKLARKGKTVKLKPREVEIKNIEILNYDYPLLELKVTTGPGVYIRSLARDIGEKLKTGGYIKQLERTKVGNFKLEDCIALENISAVQTPIPFTLINCSITSVSSITSIFSKSNSFFIILLERSFK